MSFRKQNQVLLKNIKKFKFFAFLGGDDEDLDEEDAEMLENLRKSAMRSRDGNGIFQDLLISKKNKRSVLF